MSYSGKSIGFKEFFFLPVTPKLFLDNCYMLMVDKRSGTVIEDAKQN